MIQKKLVIPLTQNKSNGQFNFCLPKKKIPKALLKDIMESKKINITLEMGVK